VLGASSAQVGTGPFYVIMEQGEGSPVARPGPNQAYWMSVSMSPTATTISATTTIGPAPSPSGIPYVWLIVLALGALVFVFLLFYFRRRGFDVWVQDSNSRAPIQGATVTADGPEELREVTEKDGRAKFGEVKNGDYKVMAAAVGYQKSLLVTLEVKKKTEYTILLVPAEPAGAPQHPPAPELATAGAPLEPEPQPGTPAPAQDESEDMEGVGGPRIREIIRKFQEKGALSPETALSAEELGLSRLFVRIMKRRRGKTTIFMEINGNYYLNKKALEEP